MSTKLCFSMLALLTWMLTFVVLFVSALKADCFFHNIDYTSNVLILGFINLITVVYFISLNLREKKNEIT